MLRVTLRDHCGYDASSLSDGSLRFIALGLLGLDPLASGLICLEEPENGIHPQRLPEMMRLVQLLAEDLLGYGLDDQVAKAASPRQVIINTHSPGVVKNLADDTLLMADTVRQQGREWVIFKALPGTWRAAGLQSAQWVSKGALATYLGAGEEHGLVRSGRRSVLDHLTRDMFAG